MIEKKLTPKEKVLLEQLDELCALCTRFSDRLLETEKELNQKNKELETIRREMALLQEENNHQKEMLQTWRQRLETALSALK
ncbi:MAG: hypothetical protein SPK70_01550 [Succinivibrio dextrinosolvens]|nr:hypothetical protein [Succinivibrio dextrinosolvens]